MGKYVVTGFLLLALLISPAAYSNSKDKDDTQDCCTPPKDCCSEIADCCGG